MAIPMQKRTRAAQDQSRGIAQDTVAYPPDRVDVAIAGGGPTGLMLALELGRRGIRVALFDPQPGPSTFPRANATQARTMELYRRLGIAGEMRSLGLPSDYPTDIAYFTRFTGYELARFELPTAAAAREQVTALSGSWSAAELPHRCSQLYIERVLLRHAAQQPQVTLHYGWAVDSWTQSDGGVALRVRHAQSDRVQDVQAGYLAGCDGARSAVRKALGISLQGEGGAIRDFFGGQMLGMHLRSAALYERIPHGRAWMYWAFNAERRGFMAAINGRDEFVFHTQLKSGESGDNLSDAQARTFFHQAFGDPAEFEILSRSAWTAGFALVAEAFGSGRVFVVGDAAHLFTPAGGLGYNTGIEDAVNLAWKLAAVVQGWGGPGLLAGYELERRPLAQRNTRYARQLADSIGLYVPLPGLEECGPQGDAARASAGTYLNTHARTEFNIPGITFGGRYDGSPLIVADGTLPPPDEPNAYVPTACPGGRAPHAWLAGARSLYDTFGSAFTLLCIGPPASSAEPMVAAARGMQVPLTVVALPDARLQQLYDAHYALIRPDQIVAWRGYELPADPLTVLARVTGHADSDGT
jgi:2-polyprenyl-6-methoxyphenol hydroxylase-like FAD-dependent oxidoreductase